MYLKIKRGLDFIFSIILLIILSPIILIVSIIVRSNLGSPIIFKQKRVGKDNKIFTLYKFRSMRDSVDSEGNLLPDSKRLTRVGKIIRKLSLDELPQLINIIKGDMSFIGPRPLVVQYLPYYTQEELKRHSIRPGISGLAQLNGRNGLEWEERFKLDVQYVESMSFFIDLKLVLKTVFKVIKMSDVGVRGNSKIVDFNKHRSTIQNDININI